MCILRLFITTFIGFCLMIRRPPRSTRTDTSFPTRRSSDLLTDNHGERVEIAFEISIERVLDCRRRGNRQGFFRSIMPPQQTAHARFVIGRSEEHTSELQSLMRISYAVFCLKKKTKKNITHMTRAMNIVKSQPTNCT